ncbi:MAG TPA: hypothetical protein VFU19_16980 [Iamia sp.]|nr:hypothetical protein [Iamia sp.]
MDAIPTTPLITAGLLRAFLTDSVPDETAIVVERPTADGVSTEPVTAVAFAMRGEGAFTLVLRST